MRRPLVLVLALLGVPTLADAELFSIDILAPDGTVITGGGTRDTSTGLDWLDVPLTASLSFNEVLAGAGPGSGWINDGWRYATSGELCDMYTRHAASSDPCPGRPGQVDVPNPNDAANLICLFGETIEAYGTAGIFDDSSTGSTHDVGIAVVVRPNTARVSHDEGGFDPDFGTGFHGSYLVRPAAASARRDLSMISIDSTKHGRSSAGHSPLSVPFVAGLFEVTLTNPVLESRACFTAWTPSRSSPSWRTDFGISDLVSFSSAREFDDSPENAFDHSEPNNVRFTVAEERELEFFIPDNVLSDNDGGVSLRVIRILDLAVTKMTVPKRVTLTAKRPEQIKTVIVHIANQGSLESILDEPALASLVNLQVEPLDSSCPKPMVTLKADAATFPIVVKTGKSVGVQFLVHFNCANDPAKAAKGDPGHEDFRYIATVDRSFLDGEVDQDAIDDGCPRTVTPPFRPDPNPDGRGRDRGCGAKKADGTFGGDVLTDIVDER